MLRASLAITLVLPAATAVADRRTSACEQRLEDARLAYQATVADTARWDFAEWRWATGHDSVRLHYAWRDYRYELAVTATTEPQHPWRARWLRGDWWLERVDHGHLASIRASGTGAMTDRAALVRAFEPALDACL